MKKGRAATQSEKNYALRRVVYDVVLAARSLVALSNDGWKFAEEEIFKVTVLMMARNLNEFLFHANYKCDDDIHACDFDLAGWRAKNCAMLDKAMARRISKSCGHVVAIGPRPFRSRQKVVKTVVPLLMESSEFVRRCRESGQAKYTRRAKRYAHEANEMLSSLGIPELSGS